MQTLRAGRFPPAGAEWIGARRRYEGVAARLLGALGLLLSGVLVLASVAGLALAWLGTEEDR